MAAQRHHHLHAALCTKDTAHRAHRYDNVSDEALRSQAQAGSAKTNSTARLLCLRWQWHPCLFSCCASPWTVKARWSQARQGKGTATDRSASGVTQHPGRARPVAGGHMPGRSLATCVSTDDESRGERAHAAVPLPSRPPASGAVPMPCLRCLPHAVMPVRNPQTTRRA